MQALSLRSQKAETLGLLQVWRHFLGERSMLASEWFLCGQNTCCRSRSVEHERATSLSSLGLFSLSVIRCCCRNGTECGKVLCKLKTLNQGCSNCVLEKPGILQGKPRRKGKLLNSPPGCLLPVQPEELSFY